MKIGQIIYSLLVATVFACTNLTQSSTDFSITDYGAVGDSTTLNTEAIQSAIDAAFEKGGGRVIVPSGKFLTGSILLKDNVELHLTAGGTLLGSLEKKDYEWIIDKKE